MGKHVSIERGKGYVKAHVTNTDTGESHSSTKVGGFGGLQAPTARDEAIAVSRASKKHK